MFKLEFLGDGRSNDVIPETFVPSSFELEFLFGRHSNESFGHSNRTIPKACILNSSHCGSNE
jgi:hypothetical protein